MKNKAITVLLALTALAFCHCRKPKEDPRPANSNAKITFISTGLTLENRTGYYMPHLSSESEWYWKEFNADTVITSENNCIVALPNDTTLRNLQNDSLVLYQGGRCIGYGKFVELHQNISNWYFMVPAVYLKTDTGYTVLDGQTGQRIITIPEEPEYIDRYVTGTANDWFHINPVVGSSFITQRNTGIIFRSLVIGREVKIIDAGNYNYSVIFPKDDKSLNVYRTGEVEGFTTLPYSTLLDVSRNNRYAVVFAKGDSGQESLYDMDRKKVISSSNLAIRSFDDGNTFVLIGEKSVKLFDANKGAIIRELTGVIPIRAHNNYVVRDQNGYYLKKKSGLLVYRFSERGLFALPVNYNQRGDLVHDSNGKLALTWKSLQDDGTLRYLDGSGEVKYRSR